MQTDECLGIFWVAWLERNGRIFFDKEENVQFLSGSTFWQAYGLSTLKEFKDIPLFFIQLDWRALWS